MFHGLEGLNGLDGVGGLLLELGDDQFHLDGEPGDTVTLADAGGSTSYADLDGDGVIDHIASVHAAGDYDVFTTDPHRAAWGLATSTPHNPGSREVAAWGLPREITPEMRTPGVAESPENAGWHRIDGG